MPDIKKLDEDCIKLFSRNRIVATRSGRIRLTVALILTVGVGVGADAYKQGQLQRNIAPRVNAMPAAPLPRPAKSAAVYSRVVWIDNNTFLHLQSLQSADNTPGAKSQISLTRYRYAPAGDSVHLQKEQEYAWPFDATLTFAREPASEICLSPDKQNLLVPLSRIQANLWEGPHYVGRVALSTKEKTPDSALWKLKIPPKRLTSYRVFWLPDSQHFVVVLEAEAIDLFDCHQNAAPVRIAADPTIPGNDSASIAKIALRDKEVIGLTPESELVLRPKPFLTPNGNRQIKSLLLERVPVAAQGVKPGRQQVIPLNTTALDVQDALLSSDGKRLLFRGFFPAPRFDLKWQSFTRPIYTSQYAALDLRTGVVAPLFSESITVRLEQNASWSFPASISWRTRTSNLNFTPRWLPGSDFVSLSPDDAQSSNYYAVWRVPVAQK